MAKYIDADKLCEGLKDMAKYQVPAKQNTILGVVATIRNTRAADVAEVRHGEWVYISGDVGYSEVKCSMCKKMIVFGEEEDVFMYCPNCGSEMDGGNECKE